MTQFDGGKSILGFFVRVYATAVWGRRDTNENLGLLEVGVVYYCRRSSAEHDTGTWWFGIDNTILHTAAPLRLHVYLGGSAIALAVAGTTLVGG